MKKVKFAIAVSKYMTDEESWDFLAKLDEIFPGDDVTLISPDKKKNQYVNDKMYDWTATIKS